MQLSNIPGKLVLPFANAGGKSTIPVASQIGITAGAASLTDGFPPLTRTPIAAGGVPPSGLDMNGILYEMSAIIRWANAGGGYPYDGTFATDTNVGGYPKGARIMRSDGTGYWFNTAENNVTDPEGAGAAAAGWVPDFTTGVAAVTMTGSSVTLTPVQYGKPIIVITGALTGNLNLIFPTIEGQWQIANATSGAFAITAKTASGTGVAILQGYSEPIFCDGVNVRSALEKLQSPYGASFMGWIQSGIGAIIRWVQDKLRESVSPEDFGVNAVPGTTDMTAAINAALAASSSVDLIGPYKITGTIEIPTGANFGGKNRQASIIVGADVVGIRAVGTGTRLRNFTLTKTGSHTKNGIEIGDATRSGGRSVLDSVAVIGMGNDGIAIRNGNLGTIRDVTSQSNGRDGIYFGIETIDNNAWRMEGYNDVAGNGRDGVHLESGSSGTDAYASKAHQLEGIVTQSNARYGVYCATRSNKIIAYSEANGTAQVYLDAYALGNEVTTVEGAVVDNSAVPRANMVINFNSRADYYRVFQNKTQFSGGSGKGLRVNDNDGTAGNLDIEKTGSETYLFSAGGNSAPVLNFTSGSASSNLTTYLNGTAHYFKPTNDYNSGHAEGYVGLYARIDATPTTALVFYEGGKKENGTSGDKKGSWASYVNDGTNAYKSINQNSSGHFFPGSDNAQACGMSGNRWSVIYAGTGTINTSDAREKTKVTPLTSSEIKAATQIAKEIGTFKFLEAVNVKGDDARQHIGLTVQRAVEILIANNLDPMAYGFICYDEWADVFVEHPAEFEIIEVPATSDTAAHTAHGEKIKDAWTELTIKAGNRYGFRYDELAMFICRGFEARLSALEKA